MPTYLHSCGVCQGEFEEVYRMADPVPTTCSLCLVDGYVKRLINETAQTIKTMTKLQLVTPKAGRGYDYEKEIPAGKVNPHLKDVHFDKLGIERTK